jgi:hypothetical protein
LSYQSGGADVTVTALGGPAGGLLANVNRWRDQVGLARTTEEQLKKDQRPLDVAGGPAAYFDLAGADKHILVVVLPHGGQTYFLKMTGSPGEVGKQQGAFEAFAKSVRFE